MNADEVDRVSTDGRNSPDEGFIVRFWWD